jgi:hypothetical protein
MKTLGGFTFIWRGNDQDYCYKETIECLCQLCDQVAIIWGGPDRTREDVSEFLLIIGNKYPDVDIVGASMNQEDWDSQIGREKLSYFSNEAANMLETDWNIYLQCDEIIHEDSYQHIREAIEYDQIEAFLVKRWNLWQDPYHILEVPQERKPCSTEVVRLAKKQYRCIDDAESIGVPSAHVYGHIEMIEIFHMGFVRHKVKHLTKIKHMLTEVFLHGSNDTRAENCDEFIPERFFDPEKDVVPIHKPLPKIIQRWAEERYPDIKKPEF